MKYFNRPPLPPKWLFHAILITLFLTGCTRESEPAAENPGSPSTEPDTEAAAESDIIIWQVYDDAYAEIWEAPLNRLLKDKGVSYSVKIQAYDSIFGEGKTEKNRTILEDMKNAGIPADVLSIPPAGTNYIAEGTGYSYQFPYSDAVDSDLLIPLDDYLDSASGQQIREAIHPNDLAASRISGGVYGLSQHLRPVRAVLYNKDCLEHFDINITELSSDFFENEELLRPVWDHVDSKTTPYIDYNVTGSLGYCTIPAVNALVYNSGDDTMQNLFDTDALKTYYDNLYSLKNKGMVVKSPGLSNDFLALTDMVYTDQAYETTYSFITSDGTEIPTEVIVVPDMNMPAISLNWGDSATGIASWSERKEDAFDFLTKLYTDPDIANLIQYGEEDIHHTIDADGYASYTAAGYMLSFFSENFTNPLLTYPQSNMRTDKRTYMNDYYETYDNSLPFGFRFDISPVAEEVDMINSIYDSGSVEILLTGASADPVKTLDLINQDLKEAGIDKVVEEAEHQLKKWRDEHEN